MGSHISIHGNATGVIIALHKKGSSPQGDELVKTAEALAITNGANFEAPVLPGHNEGARQRYYARDFAKESLKSLLAHVAMGNNVIYIVTHTNDDAWALEEVLESLKAEAPKVRGKVVKAVRIEESSNPGQLGEALLNPASIEYA